MVCYILFDEKRGNIRMLSNNKKHKYLLDNELCFTKGCKNEFSKIENWHHIKE